ncbi:MAG TPA: Gfo/Idh/MocA family oxidoreductase [Acidimicrobiia bacterium]|nr:Gfo/Idh/MocA family oxidoreductase [Acidimicrobiia bacterium]
MRVAVIGSGFGARVVAPVYAATAGCTVVGVVSARDERAVAALCARPDVDLVSVHSPPFLHAAHVQAALDAGHAVLCDKPFGLDAADATAMLDAAEAAGRVHLVNFELRHVPMRRRMRDLVCDGAVGRVEHVQWTHLSTGSRVPLRPYGWLFDRSLGGGWIGAWGSHAVDTVRWIFGPIVAARAECRVTIAERPDREGTMRRCDAEDAFTATLRTESGATVAIDTSFVAAAPLAPRIAVLGSDGVLECVDDRRIVLRRADGTRDEIDTPPSSGDRHDEPMRRWAEIVRDAVHDGAAPPGAPTFVDGVACVRVLDELRRGRP